MPVFRPTFLPALGIVLAAATSTVALDAYGRASRRYGRDVALATRASDVPLLRSPGEVLREWHERGVRGRVVVHVGRFLHFVPLEPPLAIGREAHRQAELVAQLVAAVDHPNYLYIAADLGLVRHVYYVVTPGRLVERQRSVGAPVDPQGTLDIPDGGFLRELSSTIPRIDEPVLLDIHASYFEDGDAGELYAQLESAGLRADVVTLCLGEGADDVSDRARNRLRAFARSFTQLRPRPGT